MVWLYLLFFIAPDPVQAQTTLVAGDIVVLGWNSDDTYPDQRWAFMTMVNISANTTIIFTDNGYDSTTSNFRGTSANDGFLKWVVPSAIPKGKVIYGTNNTVNGSSSGVTGQLGQPGTPGFGFSPAGDQIIVYQGTSGTAVGATFIYALNTGQSVVYGSNGAWIHSGIITIDQFSYQPPGLTDGSTAVALTTNVGNMSSGTGALGSANYGFDNMYYGGTTSGNRSFLITAVAAPTNWIGDNTNTFNLSTGGVFPTNTFSVLPVTLNYFTAQASTASTVQLTWGTAMESNNDHFTLERSDDGIHYVTIGTLPGKGDYSQPTDYSYTDHSPEQGVNFYRLSQTDRDGKDKVLGIKTVTLQDVGLRLGPNPAVHVVDVSFNRGAWREIKLYNCAEQLLQTIPLTARDHQAHINLLNYRAGTYYLAFVGTTGANNTVRQFVKR